MKRIVITVLSTVFLGAIGSGLWELMFRPGLSTLGTFLGSWSVWVDHQIYTSAALDPRPVPSLVGLLLLCALPLALSTIFFAVGFVLVPLDKWLDRQFDQMVERRKVNLAGQQTDDGEPDHEIVVKHVAGRWLRYVGGLGCLLTGVIGSLAFTVFTITNDATVVWRSFHANLDILAQSVPESDIRRLKREFRQMKTRVEFESIRSDMNALASRVGDTKLNWSRM